MAETHEPRCDGNHTDRQACNRSLDQMSAESGPIAVAEEAVAEEAAGGMMVLEAPSVLAEAATFDAAAPAWGDRPGERDIEATTAALPAQRDQMPAPSPWAVRAWEDTAAAVGATATAAPPPVALAVDDGVAREQARGVAGHVPLLVGIGAAAALAIVIARRRGS